MQNSVQLSLEGQTDGHDMCFQPLCFMTFGKCILLGIGELLYPKAPLLDRALLTSKAQSAIPSQSPLNRLFCPAVTSGLPAPDSF